VAPTRRAYREGVVHVRKLPVLIAAGLAVLGTVAVGAPANATTSGDCGTKLICIYNNTGYDTSGGSASYDGYTQNSYFSGHTNETSSWKNRTDNSVFKLVDDPGFNYTGGTLDTRNPNSNNSNLGSAQDKAERAVFVRAV
jgi:hypothetical protein